VGWGTRGADGLSPREGKGREGKGREGKDAGGEVIATFHSDVAYDVSFIATMIALSGSAHA